jgi:hypothetical protein
MTDNSAISSLSLSDRIRQNQSGYENLLLSLVYVDDEKIKRFHFNEIISRLPYMRATVTLDWLEPAKDSMMGCVASRPRFDGDSQAFSWIGTSWRDSAGQEPAGPKGFSYVYKYQDVTQVDSRQ